MTVELIKDLQKGEVVSTNHLHPIPSAAQSLCA